MSKFIAGGCSFTFGHELSDDEQGKIPSKKSWAHGLKTSPSDHEYICTAHPGSGNSGIARRVFNAVANNTDIKCVVVMWSFLSTIRLGHAQAQGSRGHTLGNHITMGHQHGGR